MIRIRTGSRLHFGLLAPAAATGRRFGGVGLMLESPGIEITAEPADSWSATGPLSARAASMLPSLHCAPCLSFRVRSAPPEHVGLGTGTQLSLAIGRLVAEACAWPDRSAPALAEKVGRGARSAIGIHGFDQGGFLIEGGKGGKEAIAPLVAREPFPATWRIILVMPRGVFGLHGTAEQRLFAQLDGAADEHAARRHRLAFAELAPALAARQFADFSAKLYEFNRLSGEAFAPAQGGTYLPAAAAWIAAIRRFGVAGVGQSSWGPTVFAITEDEQQADWLVEKLHSNEALPAADVLISTAKNNGAMVDEA